MSLELQGVTVAFDGTVAVDDVDLAVADGDLLAVLGPSGCGKSTLLRAVAGLERLDGGRIRWDGTDLAGTPTHRRGFALMFQDGQLFDHLSVARNVGYARRLQGLSRTAVRAEVDDLLDLVGLGGYADRLPRTLSGGERQRVALARSLAARPRLLLLDEPLSALDAGLRGRLAADLRRILTESGTTALLVTHDQDEAFAVADRLAIMRDGRIVQEGATADVWAHPADADTAHFLGYSRVLDAPAATALLGRPTGAVALRPSAVVAGPDPIPGGIPALVRSFRPTPDAGRLVVSVEGVGELDAVGVPGWVAQPGRPVVVRVEEHALAVLPGAATSAGGGAP
ncbi:ABC transporter ATP-binding protein [Nocardioides albidus]|uniref:ABC-type quaternary amine transporter n=1 Tax=Nocardioides albidus TaxID=1517589 RepID=A0A5C4VLL8_9ACTN|nr:ABC transporter ATP-binding protein [Nocardioides albidus]TNM36229.1 ABC transporter ATP-binding protein [Nocardioides albidus]